VLLNDLGDVGDTILSVNLTGVIPIPYGILSTLENTTKSLREALLKENPQKKLAKDQLEGVAEQTDNLLGELARVLTSSQNVTRATERILNKSQDLMTFTERLQINIQEIIEKAATLNQTLDEDFQLPSSTLQNMQKNITSLLEIIQKSHFMQLHQNAILELKAAEALLSQIQKNYQKPQRELEVLKAAASSLLSKHTSELQTAGDLAREAEVKARESDRLVHTARANLQEFREKKLRVQEEQNLTSMLIARGRRLLEAVRARAAAAREALAVSYSSERLHTPHTHVHRYIVQ